MSEIAGMSHSGMGTSSSMESSGGLSDLQQQQNPPRQQPLFHHQHFLNGDVVRSSSSSVGSRGGVGTFATGQVTHSINQYDATWFRNSFVVLEAVVLSCTTLFSVGQPTHTHTHTHTHTTFPHDMENSRKGLRTTEPGIKACMWL